jgi:serine-type D-Ala-D-Ala carboxypeptidase/endopeptidase (penicillin-binding protein 4)
MEPNLQVRRLIRLTVIILALTCIVIMGAGFAVVRLLPARLAAWQQPRLVAGRIAVPGPVADAATGNPALPGITTSGLSRALAPVLTAGALGPQYGVLVTDMKTGRVLYSLDANTGFTPASTTKLATATAALQVLGPDARLRTTVVEGARADSIVLVGGGDPTLAAGRPPASDYPQPATLVSLAAATAHALRARGEASIQLGYDTSLYTGPGLAPGWAPDDVSTGNVTVITPLEVDQGRLTPSGRPEDADDPGNFRPRSTDPAAQAAAAFAGFLRADGVAVSGAPALTVAPRGATVLASVQSPPLSQVIQWMLEESNNVIAENLARQVALATHAQPSFSGAAAAEEQVLRGLGVTGIDIGDGSGLSQTDLITPTALVRLVRLDASQPRLRAVLTGVPVYGFSGTLAQSSDVFFHGGGPALGMVRAKTGNLETVIDLAGVAYAKDGQLLAFAIMADRIRSLPAAGATLANIANVLAGCGCR